MKIPPPPQSVNPGPSQNTKTTLYNSKLYRVKDYAHKLKEHNGAEKGYLSLEFEMTDYYNFLASNERLMDNKDMMDKYLLDPYNFKDSLLANPLAVLLSVITQDNKIVFVRRTANLAEYPNTYHVAVAGSMCHCNPQDDTKKDFDTREGKIHPSPFRAACREASEEIGLQADDISKLFFWGFGRDLTNGKPELLGSIETKINSKDLRNRVSLSTTRWEVRDLVIRDFSRPREACEYLLKSEQWVPGGYVNMMMTLIGKFGLHHVKESLDYWRSRNIQ